MPRITRTDIGNHCYHVINRANARLPIFFTEKDYILFENVLEEAQEKFSMRILAYCLMPNHFHLVLYPRNDGDMGKFMQWLTLTHTQRWHQINNTKGTGHLYQGRYKSFLIQEDNHLLSVIRYVERNALRAKLVKKAENWGFCSLARRLSRDTRKKKLLSAWPISEPEDYLLFVNTPQPKEEEENIRASVVRGKPLGTDTWTVKVIKKFRLEATIRSPWRPQKGT
ncbi:MAG: transposase [bacterium]|nr:transposase [bacterium]